MTRRQRQTNGRGNDDETARRLHINKMVKVTKALMEPTRGNERTAIEATIMKRQASHLLLVTGCMPMDIRDRHMHGTKNKIRGGKLRGFVSVKPYLYGADDLHRHRYEQDAPAIHPTRHLQLMLPYTTIRYQAQ